MIDSPRPGPEGKPAPVRPWTDRPWLRPFLPASALVLLVGLWAVVSYIVDEPRAVPQVDVILHDLVLIAMGEGALGNAYSQLAATSTRLLAAFALSLLLGVTLGILAGRLPGAYELLSTPVWVCMAVPSVVWVFVFAVALGLGEVVPIAAITALLTPMILVLVAEGAKSLPRELVTLVDSYHVSLLSRIKDVHLPFLTPYIVGAARVSFALGVKLVIVAEVIGLSRGVGYEVDYWYVNLETSPIIAWGIVLAGLGMLFDRLVFKPLEQHVTRWRSNNH